MRFQPNDLVRVPYPQPGQEHEPRESWPWLPAVVCSVAEPDAFQRELEYAVAIQDERVAEPAQRAPNRQLPASKRWRSRTWARCGV